MKGKFGCANSSQNCSAGSDSLSFCVNSDLATASAAACGPNSRLIAIRFFHCEPRIRIEAADCAYRPRRWLWSHTQCKWHWTE